MIHHRYPLTNIWLTYQQRCCIYTHDTFLQTLKYHSCWLNQHPLLNTPRACIGLPKSSVFDWVTCIYEWEKSPPNASLTQLPITTHNQHLSSSSSHLLTSWCLHMPPLILWTHGRSHASLHAFLCNVHNVNFKQEFVRPRWPYDMRPSARAEKYMCVILIR